MEDVYVANSVAESIANRDNPIPVVKLSNVNGDEDATRGAAASNGTTTSEQASDSRMLDKKASAGSSASISLQDRLFANVMYPAPNSIAVHYHNRQPRKVVKHRLSQRSNRRTRLFEQLIPPSDDDGTDGSNPVLDGPSSSNVERPGFSLAVMSGNFRRFNARIGVVFVFQARAIRLFSWHTPSHTLSFLTIYTFLCVYPYLLLVVPLCMILLFVMVPAYLARHPAPPNEDAGPDSHAMALAGPAIAPPRTVKPAPELSHDFFRNMRDIQNSMADFSMLHDAILTVLTPWTNFADESRSSAAFLSLTLGVAGLALLAPILPFRAIALVGGWALIGSSHPKMQQLTASMNADRAQAAQKSAISHFQNWVQTDFEVDEAPEILEVEVFELQRRKQTSSLASMFAPPMSPQPVAADGPAAASEYEAWLFSPTAWEPQTPARRAGARPKGTRFFEDVKAPAGWEWAGKKWVLDPGGEGVGEDWVAARLLRGLEVEEEGERWVYDLVDVGEDTAAATAAAAAARAKKQPPRSVPTTMAQYDVDKEAVVFRGEWRRRRWVRSVRRAKVYGSGVKVVSDVSGGPARGKMRDEAKDAKDAK